LVEMAAYFDAMILQRIQRAMYTPEWDDLKPKREPTPEEVERAPRLVKVIRLESYEDALHNVGVEDPVTQTTERGAAYERAVGSERYRLQYLVRLPVEASASMLQLARL